MKHFISFFLLLFAVSTYAQERGVFSGGFESNLNLFVRDSIIGADNIPQYDRQLTGGEAWLNLNYSINGLEMGVRFDIFNNSNLRLPTDSYTDQGIGRWFIRKQIDKLKIEAGYLYDRIGSGMIYNAYEVRPLLIDNALYGVGARYELNEDWSVRAFTGKQKNLFDTYEGVIKGAAINGFLSLGSEESPLSLAPGVGFVNRTLSDGDMDKLINVVKNYLDEDRIKPVYNTYAFSFFNTLTYKSFSWYLETAFKSSEAFYDPTAERTGISGITSLGKFVKESGSILYSSISYAKGNLGITLEGKRTENFNFRVDPNLTQNRGLINYIPPMNRQNTYRLNARYSPATQDLSEQAVQVDVRYSFSRKFKTLVNFSNITDLDGELLYREVFTELHYKPNRTWQLKGGVQIQNYNQEIYEVKPSAPLVETITPYVDFLYKFTRKKSLRVEAQYMLTDQDYGSWIFGLAEVGLAPRWIFEASGMYNISPAGFAPKEENGDFKKIFYPSLGVVFIDKANRFSLKYVKQVEGVVCSGGVCRLEPAFSGLKFSVTSTF